jgi:putative alpha-1,2-mannosidase
MFTDEDRVLRALLGPFLGGEENAKRAMEMLYRTDAAVTPTIDFEDPAVRVPYLYHHIQAIDLSPEEIEQVEAARYG